VYAPVEVAIVGAGPYGLSLAAHLDGAGIQTRVFGRPMESWRRHMPEGMLLKSDPFASNLSDPQEFYTLARFSEEQSIPCRESETGFRIDLSRLTLLSPALRRDIAEYRRAPILTGNFESAVPGLYFIRPAAAASFGPMMRFTFGARYAARRLTRALVRSQRASAKGFAGSPLDRRAGTPV
jgi:hypothetical protein